MIVQPDQWWEDRFGRVRIVGRHLLSGKWIVESITGHTSYWGKTEFSFAQHLPECDGFYWKGIAT